jgi:RNA polymerase sigma-70 factor, ECF subfamily
MAQGGSGGGDDGPPDAVIAAWNGGDPEAAFEQLFSRYYRPLSYFFAKKGFSSDECHDLNQETFLRVFNRMDTFRGEGPFKAWLFQIAANIYRNTLRERSTQKRDAQEVSLDEASDQPVAAGVVALEDEPLEHMLNDERVHKLREAMEELPPQMRRCVQLRIDQDLRYREIAVILGVSIDTVKAHLYQARQLLKAKLKGYFTDVDV